MRNFEIVGAFVLVFSIQPASAQLINGSFESNGSPDLTGWTSVCGTMASSSNVPGGTGAWSLTMEQVDHWTCEHDVVYQEVPFVHMNDIWTIGAWARADEDAQEGMVISFGVQNGTGFDMVGTGFGTQQTVWSHASVTTGIWSQPGQPIYLVLDAGNLFPDSTYGHVWFDDITLTPLSTGIPSAATRTPAFRPNPATDKLWVDLAEAPESLMAMDATGRIMPIASFTHRDHTLEVDLTGLPPGLTLMMMTSGSGTRTVRFLKT